MNGEETRIEKKVMVTYFTIHSHHLPGGTEEYQDPCWREEIDR
jgi:hypothetical protein